MRAPAALLAALLTLASVAVSSTRPVAASGCDLSFVLNEPTYQLINPSDGDTAASFISGRLTIATDARDLSGISEVEFAPLSGKPIVVHNPRFEPAPAASAAPTVLGGRVASFGTARVPHLSASTSYTVIVRARTAHAPQSCPTVLTEHIGRFTTEPPTALDALGDLTHAIKPPSGSAAHPNAQSVYLKALSVLRTLTYPHYVTYVVTTHSTISGKPFVESFHSLVRTDTDVVATHGIPFASTNVPENPYGFNIPILTALLRRGPREHFDEPFGTPEISPLFSFGLRRLTTPDSENPEPLPSPGADVKTLGRVVTVGHFYDVSFVGVEPYGSRYVYHLRLTAVADPRIYRVRDLWIDTQAYVVWKLRSDGIFDQGNATTASWDVSYTIAGGHWFMAQEATAQSFGTGNFWHGNQTHYEGVSYTLSDYSYPDTVPDFSFFTGQGETSATQF